MKKFRLSKCFVCFHGDKCGDKQKKQNAEKYGYHILYIWESELNEIDDAEIEEFVVKKIKDYSAITPNKLVK